MSHDTHEHEHHSANDNPSVAFKSAFYFVIILAGLFVAAIGFVKSMSHDEGGHGASQWYRNNMLPMRDMAKPHTKNTMLQNTKSIKKRLRHTKKKPNMRQLRQNIINYIF